MGRKKERTDGTSDQGSKDSSQGQNPRYLGLLAEEAEQTVPTPAALDRAAVEEAPAGIADEVEHVALPDRAAYNGSSALLVGQPDGDAHGVGGRDRLLAAVLDAPGEHLIKPPVAVELHHVHLRGLGESDALIGEMTNGVVRVVVESTEADGFDERRRFVGRNGDRLDHPSDERSSHRLGRFRRNARPGGDDASGDILRQHLVLEDSTDIFVRTILVKNGVTDRLRDLVPTPFPAQQITPWRSH